MLSGKQKQEILNSILAVQNSVVDIAENKPENFAKVRHTLKAITFFTLALSFTTTDRQRQYWNEICNQFDDFAGEISPEYLDNLRQKWFKIAEILF